MRTIPATVFTLATLLIASAAQAQEVDPFYQQTALFGINRTSAELSRYNFADGTFQAIGRVTDGSGNSMLDINASAYVPGHMNIFAFWNDPSDSQTKMVYVNTMTAKGTVVGNPMGPGQMTGAVAGSNSGTASISGLININPNNSPDNEFILNTADGSTYTRDHLHQNSNVDGSGTFYQGAAHYVRVKPKGNGNQSGLIVNGEAFSLNNNTAYKIVGPMAVRVYNDQINGNGKAMGKWWIEITAGTVSVFEGVGMVAGGGSNQTAWVVYGVQKVEAAEDPTVDFNIEGDRVVPTEDYAAKITVLGAAITYGGHYTVPVTMQVKNGTQTYEPFGDFGKALDGNVNDNQNPREFIIPGIQTAGTAVDVLGRAWIKKKFNRSGNSENHWKIYMTVDGSQTNSQQVIVLRNGDDAPDVDGFLDQNDVADFVKDYIDPVTNKIVLDENQAIFLYELGTTSMSSSAADFQDLVVLVTLAKDPGDFAEGDDDDNAAGPASRLVKIDQKTGGFAQLMTLDREYDGLATRDGLVFFATHLNELYQIDITTQTETLVGNMAHDNVTGVEFAGTTLMGFEIDNDTLRPIDVSTGDPLGAPASVTMTDLGTIIFMPTVSDPSAFPVAFD